MTHRAEQIMAAVTTAVTGLATTGGNVFRGRSELHDLGDLEVPALLVFQGDDTKQADLLNDVQEWDLEIGIDIVTAETAVQVDTVLNQIRGEVTRALAANFTLGLAFVGALEEISARAPEFSGSDRAAADCRMVWLAHYTRSRTDPDS